MWDDLGGEAMGSRRGEGPDRPTEVVDAHHHLWDPREDEYPWMVGDLAPLRRPFGPADLRPLLIQTGVTATVVVQARSHLDETRRLLAVARDTPFITGVVGWVDLTDDVPGQLHELETSAGLDLLVGVRHQVHDEPDPSWLTRSDVLRGLQAVADAGLVYDLLVRPRELPAALAAARAVPDLDLVIDHLAKPSAAAGAMEPWEERLRAFGPLPNVAVKLSGMVTEADWDSWHPDDLEPYLEVALEVFGEERAMFGSDWPVCLLASDYGEVRRTLDLLLERRGIGSGSPIWGATAIETYGL